MPTITNKWYRGYGGPSGGITEVGNMVIEYDNR